MCKTICIDHVLREILEKPWGNILHLLRLLVVCESLATSSHPYDYEGGAIPHSCDKRWTIISRIILVPEDLVVISMHFKYVHINQVFPESV